MCPPCGRSSQHTCPQVGKASTPSGFLPNGTIGTVPKTSLPNTYTINRFLKEQPLEHDAFIPNCQCRAECMTPDAYMEQTYTFPRTNPVLDRHNHDEYTRHMTSYPENRVYLPGQPGCFNDEGIAQALQERSRRLVKMARSWELSELKNWKASERETTIQNALDANAAQFAGPKFRNGQAVFQWWASWLSDKSIKEPPATMSGKTRPKWYSGMVLGHQGLGDILYAGIQHTNVHLYSAY